MDEYQRLEPRLRASAWRSQSLLRTTLVMTVWAAFTAIVFTAGAHYFG